MDNANLVCLEFNIFPRHLSHIIELTFFTVVAASAGAMNGPRKLGIQLVAHFKRILIYARYWFSECQAYI